MCHRRRGGGIVLFGDGDFAANINEKLNLKATRRNIISVMIVRRESFNPGDYNRRWRFSNFAFTLQGVHSFCLFRVFFLFLFFPKQYLFFKI